MADRTGAGDGARPGLGQAGHGGEAVGAGPLVLVGAHAPAPAAAGQAVGQVRPLCLWEDAWRAVWDCAAGNRAKVCLWRLMHARLPVGLYLAAKRPAAAREQRHLCPACRAGPHAEDGAWCRPLDSISHLFLQCPRYAAARVWLQRLWAAVGGEETSEPPVDNAACLLAGQPSAWAKHPTVITQARLWHTFRALFVHALWCAARSKDPEQQTARAVCLAFVEEARRLMRCQWSTAAQHSDTLDALPTSLLTTWVRPDKAEDLFIGTWTWGNVLCRVCRQPGMAPDTLDIRLSASHPVPVPPSDAAAVGP